MSDIDDLINAAMLGQPTKFASAFDSVMGQKAVEAIDDMRVPIAQSMFGSEEEPEEDFEDEDLEEDEVEEEDFDDDDWADDLEDLDFDDEDLELDDEDLEGFEDDGEDA